MTDTTAGFDHQSDACLAIDRALTPEERATILDRICQANPRMCGAQVADVLDMTTSTDAFLRDTEPFWEAHEAELEKLRGITPALHALILLGADLSMANLIHLLERAGLIADPDAPHDAAQTRYNGTRAGDSSSR